MLKQDFLLIVLLNKQNKYVKRNGTCLKIENQMTIRLWGVTKEPITNEEHLTLHPLHSYLRVFGWIYKKCYHAVAGHFNWSESKFEGISKSQGVNNLIESKRKIQKCVEEEINVALEKPDPTGHGGTSTTGNVVKTLLNTNNRTLLTKHISDVSLKENIDKIILYVSIILC